MKLFVAFAGPEEEVHNLRGLCEKGRSMFSEQKAGPLCGSRGCGQHCCASLCAEMLCRCLRSPYRAT